MERLGVAARSRVSHRIPIRASIIPQLKGSWLFELVTPVETRIASDP